MKSQALLSSNDKSKKLKCRLLQYLFGALRVKTLRRIITLFSSTAVMLWMKTGKANSGELESYE